MLMALARTMLGTAAGFPSFIPSYRDVILTVLQEAGIPIAVVMR